MASQYYILTYPGAGLCFFTSIFNIYLTNKQAKILDNGSCHDFGYGEYVDTPDLTFLGWNKTKEKLKKLTLLYNGHDNHLANIKKDNPELKIVYVYVDKQDYKKISTLRFYKAMINKDFKKEYYKFTSKFPMNSWPNLNDVLSDPECIKNDIINFDSIWHEQWHKEINMSCVNYTINWKDAFNKKCSVLNKCIANILQKQEKKSVENYIKQYQQKNLQLYREFLQQ